MSLEELHKELDNATDPSLDKRGHEKSDYDPWVAHKQAEDSQANPFMEQHWNEPKKGLDEKQKKKLKIAFWILGGVILLALAAWGFSWWQKNAFHQERVTVSFEGPSQVDNTEITKYVINYKNDNYVALKNVEIDLQYPENFQPTDSVNLKILSTTTSKFFIPDIKAKSEGTVELKGIFYAPQNYPVILQASILYTPSNQGAQLSNSSQIGVTVTKSPVTLNLTAPQSASDGDSVEYVIDYSSVDVREMDNIQVRVDFPDGFEFTGSEPQASEKNAYWYVGTLQPNQTGQIRIQGKLQGDAGSSKTITASLGSADQSGQFSVYQKMDATTQMIAPVLSITQSLAGNTNNIVNAGDTLSYVVVYKNSGTIGLRDDIVTVQLQGNVLDLSKLKLNSGSFDSNTNIITWKASDIPALASIAPGQGGEIDFSVPVKQVIPVSGPNDKDFEITTVAKIDSPDIPTPVNSNKTISSNTLDLKLASKVIFANQAFYKDQTIPNSGPIPIQVGKETTLTIHWSITSVSNDLANAKVISSLPSGVQWKGVISPQGENITFDSRTNQIEWDAGSVAAGAGVISPAKTVAFQVSVTPESSQVGGPIPLINALTLTATDTFVSQDVNIQNPKRNTELPEDQSVGYVGGHVVAAQ